jgi:hypothetical protein
LTRAGAEALAHWTDIIAAVFTAEGASKLQARTKAQNLIATMEGALLLARVRQSSRPIMDIAATYR